MHGNCRNSFLAPFLVKKSIYFPNNLQKNAFPGYECACFDGFRQDSSGVCVDVDECEEGDEEEMCGRGGECNNTEGSYDCRCKVRGAMFPKK